MITLKQLELLSEAITMANEWRGGMVGAAPKEDIEEFDSKILQMRIALKAARDARLALRRLYGGSDEN